LLNALRAKSVRTRWQGPVSTDPDVGISILSRSPDVRKGSKRANSISVMTACRLGCRRDSLLSNPQKSLARAQKATKHALARQFNGCFSDTGLKTKCSQPFLSNDAADRQAKPQCHINLLIAQNKDICYYKSVNRFTSAACSLEFLSVFFSDYWHPIHPQLAHKY
jgi:hypothetical protein